MYDYLRAIPKHFIIHQKVARPVLSYQLDFATYDLKDRPHERAAHFHRANERARRAYDV